MGLALVLGPAKAGKIAHLLDGYLAALERDPVLIVPNRADVDRVERDLLRRVGRAPRQARSARSTTCSASSRGGAGGRQDRSQETRSGRSSPVAPSPARRSTASTAPRASPASPTRCSACSPSSRPACSTPIARDAPVDGDLGPSTRPTARSSTAVGLWDRDLLRRRAVERLALGARRVGRPARLRLRVRGPDRRRVGAARGALRAGRGHRVAAVRARPRRLRVAAADAGGPRLARRRRDRGAAGARRRVRPPGARAPRAAPVRGRAAGRSAASSTARSASSRRAGARGTLELVARGGAGARGSGHPARGDRARRPVGRALARPGRDRARHARHPVRGRGPPAARPDAVRAGAAGAAPLRLAAGWPPRPLLATSARPSRASRARTSTSSRAAFAAAPSPRARRRGGDDPAPRRSAAPAARGAAVGRRAGRGGPCARRAMLRAAHGVEAPPVGEAARGDLRAYEAVVRLLDELDGWTALGGELSPDDVIAVLERGEVRLAGAGERGPDRGPRPLARADAPLRGRLPARPRGGDACRAAATLRRSSTTTPAASSTARPAPGSCAPTRSSATATSSTPPARARRAG